AFEREPVGYGHLLVPELAEAAARTGDTELVQAALHWPDQPGDRRPAVHQRQHRRIPPAQDLPQAWRQQPGSARPDDPRGHGDPRPPGLRNVTGCSRPASGRSGHMRVSSVPGGTGTCWFLGGVWVMMAVRRRLGLGRGGLVWSRREG